MISKHGKLSIGKNVHIGIGSVLTARNNIQIGDYALIAAYVTIRDQDHDFDRDSITLDNGFVTSPIDIGKNVWIGAKATITKGVKIGDNAVIGANSVVTKDIAANAVAAGIPAKVLRMQTKVRTDKPNDEH